MPTNGTQKGWGKRERKRIYPEVKLILKERKKYTRSHEPVRSNPKQVHVHLQFFCITLAKMNKKTLWIPHFQVDFLPEMKKIPNFALHSAHNLFALMVNTAVSQRPFFSIPQIESGCQPLPGSGIAFGTKTGFFWCVFWRNRNHRKGSGKQEEWDPSVCRDISKRFLRCPF